ncbi:methylated-DNA--[protein]-cysteine S-methyltransferase [Leadbettera azotonutricia]|uniref:methylated-DNA--[protein]-cysteine S-methyltransferase n=1 Tax=Leadbettera azotonutricia TaxID=150829 RepID=UPI000172CDF9|nr:methylated-DNA--[protein]-cysteine S-methyltransferase [Leadbettera azotonutricia]
MIYTSTLKTPLGPITVAAENEALTGLWFFNQKYYPCQTAEWIDKSDYPLFKSLDSWLGDYFAGKNPKLDFKLNPWGTVFQRRVWNKLLKIPYGKTSTYGAIAAQLEAEKRSSPRAVGGAVGHNPISILIPCHRVIGSSGNITGYAGGIDKKLALLRIEQIFLSPQVRDDIDKGVFRTEGP